MVVRVAASVVAVLGLGAAGVWSQGVVGGDGDGSSGVALPSGAVRIRAVAAPALCLGDGNVPDGRYPSLVGVARTCAGVPPQRTDLVSTGEGTHRIRWWHPDHGTGCLRVLEAPSGAGLLEPRNDCGQGTRFEVERVGTPGPARYVFGADGRCLGLRGPVRASGTEVTLEPCTGAEDQQFRVEQLRPAGGADSSPRSGDDVE